MHQLGNFLVIKWDLIQQATLSVLYLMGLSATLARFVRKIVHRISVDSPRAYDLSFWLQVVALLYLAYTFLAYWELGLIRDHWLLKMNLLVFNTVVFFVIKVVFIERAQMHIIRDLAVVNMVYISYILCYCVAGFPWCTYFLYLSATMNQIICQNLLDQLSPHLHSSIGLVFNDPENLDELVRLNIND
mmetsp:Transcript_11553/g.15611  ORF Transcript_11553/g.15611 Transcript_11553/m.15611 type:complete len:188 (-) Transcript_11553:66-629(-)